MRFETGRRTVALSVGEFATFSMAPASFGGGRAGAWRAAVGTAWHQTMRERAAATTPTAQFEVPIQGRLLHRGWSLVLQGRVDQLLPRDGGWVIQEIKTVSRPLPRAPEDLAQAYPEYFRQLAAYLRLAELDPAMVALLAGAPVTAELVLVDFAAGLTQTVPLTRFEADHWLEQQCEILFPYLEFRWNTRQRLAALPERAAFEILRPGQMEARTALANATGHAGVIVFEAPTGFGKTGLLLEYALARLREGHSHRLLYLTGKGTGQTPVTKQLRALLGDEPALRYIQLRSRREHAISSALHVCDSAGGTRGNCRTELEERWRDAGLDVLSLFDDATLPLEKSRRLGAETGVCPYEITRAALPYAEVWVCDYNYVFSPAHRSVLFNQPGFDPALTMLVLDEAHNLPARAAEARSHVFLARDAHMVFELLREQQARQGLVRAAEQLAEFLGPLRCADRLDLTATYTLADHLESIAEELRAAPPPENLPDFAYDFLWAGAEALGTLRNGALELLPWVPSAGELRLTCVDAAPAIAACLREFGQSVLTSATFGPPELFLEACGLEQKETRWISATAPWREGAYDMAVDARVDTRLRARASYYAATAETVRLFAAGQPRPVAVFFPSYDYAEAVHAYLEGIDPGTRVAVQPRGAGLAEQTEFLDVSLLTAHAIFFVLGGSFAEGIDRLGGEIERAMVVGPALPEPSPVNEARRARWAESMGEEEAFRRAYLAPGILKVAQALGRLVRAPGQHAKVLLHCRRFAEPATQSLLPAEYCGGPVLRKDSDFAKWVEK